MIRSFEDTFECNVDTVFDHLIFMKDSYDWVPSHLRVKNEITIEDGRPIKYEIESGNGDSKFYEVQIFSAFSYAEEVRMYQDELLDKDRKDVRKNSWFPYTETAVKITFREDSGKTIVHYQIYFKPKSIFRWLECYYDTFKEAKLFTLEMNNALKKHLQYNK